MIIPNHYDCHECPDWDSVNSCWKNYEDVFQCPRFKKSLEVEEIA